MGRPYLDEARARVEQLEELVEQVARRSRPMPSPRPPEPRDSDPDAGEALTLPE